jgi:hypothetical protein
MNRPITEADLATAQRVLAAASLRDPHMPRADNPAAAAVAAALAEDLAGINPDAAVEAVSTHYRQTTDRIMPAHIWAIVRGSDASRNPAYRPLAEAVAAAEREAGGTELPALPAAGTVRLGPAQARAALEAALRVTAATTVIPDDRPTGYTPKRQRPGQQARRSAQPRPATPAGLTVCHRCVVDIQAPVGWDPASLASEPLYCARCAAEVAAETASQRNIA